MANEIQIIKRDEQKALVVRDKVSMLQTSKAIGRAYGMIIEFMKRKGYEPEGAPFTSYKVDNWEKTVTISGLKMFISVFTQKWDITSGFHVPDDMDGEGLIEAVTQPSGEYFHTVHIGPYYKIGEVYKRIYALANEQNRTLDNITYEYYENDPADTPKDKLETRVIVRIIG